MTDPERPIDLGGWSEVLPDDIVPPDLRYAAAFLGCVVLIVAVGVIVVIT